MKAPVKAWPTPISACAIAASVRSGETTAEQQTIAALDRIAEFDTQLNSCTRVLRSRALTKARQLDRDIADGKDPGPLAGVPFGAKDLFDIAGLPNTAGAASRQNAAPATNDAEAIARLEAAGAILVASCNMDEFAYGFVTVNAHHGTTRNPHDLARLAGGSSGGSAAVVAGGLLPLALGSDTNGSIRVPASLCGVYGLKPTHGALPLDGVMPFVDSFDDIGPFAATLADCTLAWRVLRGGMDDAETNSETKSAADLRVGVLGGFFADHDEPELSKAMDQIAHSLGNSSGHCETVTLPDVQIARSAAYLMTAYEGGQLHLEALRSDPLAYDPATRARLIAGAIMDPEIYRDALAMRADFLAATLEMFERFDVLIAPSVPSIAPLVADPVISMNGVQVPARAHLGLFTQPLSFIGLPALSVPLRRAGQLPLGVQVVAAPGRDAVCFAVAQRLETAGLTAASHPSFPQLATTGDKVGAGK